LPESGSTSTGVSKNDILKIPLLNQRGTGPKISGWYNNIEQRRKSSLKQFVRVDECKPANVCCRFWIITLLKVPKDGALRQYFHAVCPLFTANLQLIFGASPAPILPLYIAANIRDPNKQAGVWRNSVKL
jgi:hypothetical protein